MSVFRVKDSPYYQFDFQIKGHRFYGSTESKNERSRGGVPPRADLDAMLAIPRGTDVPAHWVREFSKARDQLDEAEGLPDGPERRATLIDSASDIEEQAIQEFLK
jgi:hypothetical protein